jgi:hypothetical protein
MLELVREHHAEQQRVERDAEERRRRGVTFRELVHEWLVYLECEKGAKPSTVIDYGWMVAEPGQPHRRGQVCSFATSHEHLLAHVVAEPRASS